MYREMFEIENGILKRINLPEDVTGVVIPDSVVKIDWNAFWNCASLESIIIQSNINRLNPGVFSACKCLKKITMPFDIWLRQGDLYRTAYELSYEEVLECLGLNNKIEIEYSNRGIGHY